MKKIINISILTVAMAVTFSFAMPAKAFYIELPQILKNFLSTLGTNNTSAEEQQVIAPAPPEPTPPTPPQPSPEPNPGPQQPGPEPQPQPQPQPQPPQQPPQQPNYGPSPEQQLKQIKNSIKQLQRSIKEYDRMIAQSEKSGITVPDDIKQNLVKLKDLVAAASNVSTMEEMQNVDMGEMQDLSQSLDQYRQDVFQANQRLQDMKRNIKGMESQLNMFEKQVAKFQKQKISIPTNTQENILNLRNIINSIKNATTADQLNDIDFNSMSEAMENLNQDRQTLEMLARWPQTLKQMDKQLTMLTRELKRAKQITDKLVKKGIDIQSVYNAFEEAVNKLKAVKADAVSKMATDDSQGAFDTVENDFFGQMDDIMQNDQIIMMMGNLGSFNSTFKQSVNQAQQTINQLKKKKIDTSELVPILDEIKVKGQEIKDLIASKNYDVDTITSALDDLENLRQDFGNKVNELTGQEGEIMPWEQGPQQFKQVQMPQGMQQYMPQQPQQPMMQQQPTMAPGTS
ncbi:MAG: hypothetical protein WC526_01285 [Patescibacteria group bacterium]